MTAFNKDFPIFTAIVLRGDERKIFTAFKQSGLVSKLVKEGIYEVAMATESNPVEGYCIETTADVNLDLFRVTPKPAYVPKRQSVGFDRMNWEKGIGRYGPFGA